MNEMLFREKQNSQSGQAVVEYVLLIVVAVALILGLGAQFYKPMGDFWQNYMGDYLECLLDVGELPTVGNSSDSGICNARFKPGTWAGGRPPIDNSNRNQSYNDDLNTNRNGSSSSDPGGGVGSGRGSNSRSRSMNLGGQGAADGAQSGGQGEKQIVEKLPESQFFRTRRSASYIENSNSSGRGDGETMTVPLRGPAAKEKKETTVKVETEEINGNPSQAKKMVIKAPERKTASMEDDEPWSFGQYIKIALIVVIIIALVLFLGGQIMQISKSMEK